MEFTGKVARDGAGNTATGATQKGLASMQQSQSIYEKVTRSDTLGARLFRYNLVSICHKIETGSYS